MNFLPRRSSDTFEKSNLLVALVVVQQREEEQQPSHLLTKFNTTFNISISVTHLWISSISVVCHYCAAVIVAAATLLLPSHCLLLSSCSAAVDHDNEFRSAATGSRIISTTSHLAPSSISLILCLAGIAFFHCVSKNV
jgi:hypothetical protein